MESINDGMKAVGNNRIVSPIRPDLVITIAVTGTQVNFNTSKALPLTQLLLILSSLENNFLDQLHEATIEQQIAYVNPELDADKIATVLNSVMDHMMEHINDLQDELEGNETEVTNAT